MFGLSTWELLICGLVAVLLFGSRLPSVARSLGKSLTEFKRGMRDVENDVRDAVYSEPVGRVGYSDRAEPAVPRSEPPKAPPADTE